MKSVYCFAVGESKQQAIVDCAIFNTNSSARKVGLSIFALLTKIFLAFSTLLIWKAICSLFTFLADT